MAALAAARIPKVPPPIVSDLAANLSGYGWMDAKALRDQLDQSRIRMAASGI
jgi:hypothetical protein